MKWFIIAFQSQDLHSACTYEKQNSFLWNWNQAQLQIFFCFIFTGAGRKKKYSTGIPRLIDDCYFQLLDKDDRNWTASCKTCDAVVKGSSGVSSNLIRHLVRLHPEVHELYKSEFQPHQKQMSRSFSGGSSHKMDSQFQLPRSNDQEDDE